MIYVVTMFARAGSTMLCRCLEAGGLEVARTNERYELRFPQDQKRAGWPLMYDGQLIKVPFAWIHNLTPHRYKVVALLRDPLEIQFSYAREFKTQIDIELIENRTRLALDFLRWRGDVELSVAQYAYIVQSPLLFFESLQATGWPINAAKAAAVVDPALYRCRIAAEGA
jgi:hypothetical protein